MKKLKPWVKIVEPYVFDEKAIYAIEHGIIFTREVSYEQLRKELGLDDEEVPGSNI